MGKTLHFYSFFYMKQTSFFAFRNHRITFNSLYCPVPINSSVASITQIFFVGTKLFFLKSPQKVIGDQKKQ